MPPERTTAGPHLESWGEGWAPTNAQASGFEAELAKELGPHHPLHGMKVTVFGRCLRCDDIVATLPSDTGDTDLAVIHLTWRGARESDEHWPSFERITRLAFVTRFIEGDEHL
jgi:hypothetical protein